MCIVEERDPTWGNSLGKHLVSRLGGKELNNIAAVGDPRFHSDQGLIISRGVHGEENNELVKYARYYKGRQYCQELPDNIG